ncbi:hypothetical protein E0493_18455 [Roseomonas sp. M0104]|uniref:PIN like domain-containing protein n=1 Tax=Teichococcus coralli TaxID=2545983 RepID=A0A845BCL6_9PROT|nr:hypothetical protein [Pseudoroseomonas coralli]MXP65333.1 hypothetical protein [Pseudoroseomonas coralli]
MTEHEAEGVAAETQRYFEEAASLRLSLEYNNEDYDFVRGGGRIVYLVDANVVWFFLDPVRERGHAVAFRGHDRPDLDTATALITAEFLFSRGLEGQEDLPVFLAPGHAEEVTEKWHRLRSEMGDDESAPDPRIRAVEEQLERLVDQRRTAALTGREAVRRFREEVPGLVARIAGTAVERANQLLRLYEEDAVRPLALHPDATEDILDRPETLLRKEFDALERTIAQRRQSGARPGETGHGGGGTARRDAEAIVQTMLLERAGARSDTRVVLITADQKLFEAYSEWYWRENAQAGPGRASFVLRPVLQYVPILNVEKMPNGIGHSDVMRRTRHALDALFANLRAVDPGYPHTLAIHRTLARHVASRRQFREALETIYGANPFDFAAEQVALFKRIRQEWQDGFRDGVVLNAELLERRVRSLNALASLLRGDKDLRTAIHEDKRRIIARIEAAHLGVNVRAGIARLMRRLQRDRMPARAPIAIRLRLPRIIDDLTVDEAMELLGGDRGSELAQRFDAAFKAEPDHEAHAFAACVAHRCSYWEAAWFHARRALELLNELRAPAAEKARAELAYLAGSAGRFAHLQDAELSEAFTLLEASIEACRREGDGFGLARNLFCRTALLLTLLYRLHLRVGLPDPAAGIPAAETRLTRLSGALEETASLLARLRREGGEAADRAGLRLLERQVRANLVSAEVLVWLRGGPDDPRGRLVSPPAKLLAEALQVPAGNAADGFYVPVVEAEHVMARFFRRAMGAGEALEAVRSIRLQAERENHLLTGLDAAEFQHFEKVLAARMERLDSRARQASLPA